MQTSVFPMPYKAALFILILISFIGTSNAQCFSNNIAFKSNYKPIVSAQFINLKAKDISSQSKKIMQDPDDRKASRALKQKGADNSPNPRNEGPSHYITIPPDTQLNNFHFDQQQLNIPAGDVINWINHDTIDHFIQVSRIIPGSFNHQPFGSKDLTPFDTLTLKFNQPGKYIFQCLSQNHNSMTGTINVS